MRVTNSPATRTIVSKSELPFVNNKIARKAYIKAGSDYPATWITYLPQTFRERESRVGKINYADPDERAKLVIEGVADLLKSWEFDVPENLKSQTPEPSKEMVEKLSPMLGGRFTAIILFGHDGGDVDPRSSETEPPEPPIIADEKAAKN